MLCLSESSSRNKMGRIRLQNKLNSNIYNNVLHRENNVVILPSGYEYREATISLKKN